MWVHIAKAAKTFLSRLERCQNNSFKCKLVKSQCAIEGYFYTVLTFTYVSHLQVLIGANTGVSKQWVFNSERAAILSVASVKEPVTTLWFYTGFGYLYLCAEQHLSNWLLIFEVLPFCNNVSGAKAEGVLHLIARTLVSTRGVVATAIISTIHRYDLAFIC